MRILPITATKADLINLLIEWTELLAKENYTEALDMFLSDNFEFEWTPKLLEQAVYGYGCTGYTREEALETFGRCDYVVTSILENENKDEIIKNIDISFFTITDEEGKALGVGVKDYTSVVGDIHYFDIPINGEMSDLTAKFWIKKVDEHNITLAFQDMHMM